ncbi:MAG TPA: non-homologous end-joining DNA ligase [Acidimicrobiia bacterium]|nr:non-homologous end-joining DNA ligase [Acidimicrobiia bacterium]
MRPDRTPLVSDTVDCVARSRMPTNLRPMLATLTADIPHGDGWAWELKWDGIRALAFVEGGHMRLLTRNGNDVTHRYPELAPFADALHEHAAVLDGEIVAFDARGIPSFERLQQRMHVDDRGAISNFANTLPVTYVLFDLLWLDGRSLLDAPYTERRGQLLALGLNDHWWRTPAHEIGDGSATLDVSRRFGLEGVMAKRVDSRYEPGGRSRAWLKIKHQLRQEFVVGGWQPGLGGRTGSIGSLLIGYYDGDVLHYAGKAGSGLSQSMIAALERHFAKRKRATSPFGAGAVPRGVEFVEPDLVVEVRFTEWTSGGGVRHPTFLGLRDDKEPRDVVKEAPPPEHA